MSRRLSRLRQFLSGLLQEGMDPRHAAAAVFVGVFIGIVPIYGLQSVIAIGLAVALKLNKPLTFAATFINNPFLQPLLIFSGLQLGHALAKGRLLPLTPAELASVKLSDQLAMWLTGTIVLAVLAATVAALLTYLLLRLRPRPSPVRTARRACVRFVNSRFQNAASSDRGFARWKMRLDRIFDVLLEDSGHGAAVDLGCGYGLALGMLAARDPKRRLTGCDLDSHRIDVARQAFRGLDLELAVADVREFPLPPCGLILIFDVLQYLNAAEQRALLSRCCAALLPGGMLLFRIPDRERGVFSRLSLALDGAIFRSAKLGRGPVVLSAAEYRQPLEAAGMLVSERRMRNRLPLAHLVFSARKPAEA